MILIIATLHENEMAHIIGKGLLQERLIACYNLAPIESAYWWKQEILEEHETVVIMKSTEEKFKAIEAYFMQHSGYEVPELIAIKPYQVNAPYLKWVEEETRKEV